MRIAVLICFFFSLPAVAVEAHYKLGVELKPLPILMTSMQGGQGFGVGFELNSSAYDDWVVSTTAEVYRGPRLDEGILPAELESDRLAVEETDYDYQLVAFGLRSYSNRQDDSYYLGGEIAVANENQQFTYEAETYTVKSQSLRPALEFGYRWVWQNGTLFRLGCKAVAVTNTKNRLDDRNESLPKDWAERLYQSLDRAEDEDVFYAAMDLGIGYTF